MRLFITGTDTGVGKTFVSCLILKSLTSAGHRAAGFKPVSCGSRDDAVALHQAGDSRILLDQVNPCHFEAPVSPYAAGLLENRTIDLEQIHECYAFLSSRYEHVIIEGVGGWEVPLTKEYCVSDLAFDLRQPVVIVVHNRLGALNHTILTARSILEKGLKLAGLILNHPGTEVDPAAITNRRVLEDILSVPVLAEVLHGDTEIDYRPFIETA